MSLTAALPAMDVAGRADRLREKFASAGCDALFVTSLVNIRYLTGFTGSSAMLLVLPDELVLATDGRYRDRAAAELAAAQVDATFVVAAPVSAQLERLGPQVTNTARLGLEARHVSWADQQAYAMKWFAGCELIATFDLVEELRVQKDDGEIARIEAAARVATDALDHLRGRLLEGPTEAEFALELDSEMRRRGASGPSFDTIVASGPNGARPHHQPSGRRIVAGDLVVIDYGALVDGYCSDMTRTVVIGEPSPTQARMLDIVTAAQAAGVAAVRPGARCADVDRACRDVIAEAGWGDAFLHGTGHGVGLQIHEDPRVSWSSDGTLADRSVVTVEPGVYLPEHGGVRIEDTLVVTSDGARSVTHAPKDHQWPSRPTT